MDPKYLSSDRVTTVTTVTDGVDEPKENAGGLSDRVTTVTVTKLKDNKLQNLSHSNKVEYKLE